MPIKALVFDAYGTLFDVQSVAAATEAAFPGHGTTITQIWRLKQLEYTWLRALMDRYEDFWTVTTESLDFTLKTLGLAATPEFLAEIAGAYDALALYPEARAALEGLASYRLAIYSNGSPAMLKRLVAHAGIGELLETVISVDEIGIYKPDPRGYAHVEKRLGLARDEIALAGREPDRQMLRQAPGVFCAGEMLDWEAPTGGYLLTACYASALRAAEGVVEWLR